jgi:hypothetical protein
MSSKHFASPANYYDDTKQLLMRVWCDDTGVPSLEIGDGNDALYIYKDAFAITDSGYKRIPLTGTQLGPWIVGTGKALLEPNDDGTGSVVAYMCKKDNAVWRCGCKDRLCERAHWQRQYYDTDLDRPMNIKDSALNASIREELNVTDELVVRDAFDVGNLNLYNKGLRSIEGLEYFTALRTLNIGANDLTSIDSLRGLPLLEELALYANHVPDLSPVAALPNIRNLTFGLNPIRSIEPLRDVTTLTEVTFNDTAVSDLSPLTSSIGITRLVAWKNEIDDLSPLEKLPSIEYLNLTDNEIETIDSLTSLKRLQTLYLSDNPITDITPLLEITSLDYVLMERMPLLDVTAGSEAATVLDTVRARGVNASYR